VSTNMGNLEKLGILVIVILVVVVGVVAITPKSTVDERLMPEIAQAAIEAGIEPLDPAGDATKPPVDPFPGGAMDGAQANSLDPAAAPVETFRIVKAQANDTFATISKRELASAARFTEIAKLNPELNGAKLKKGQDVKIPLAPTAPVDPKPTATGGEPGGSTPSPAPAPSEKIYTVRSGDTLSSIAQSQMKSRNKWQELQKANEDVLHGSTNLKIGMKLRIPGASGSSSTTLDPAPSVAPADTGGEREYTVRSGDSLWSIAKNQLGGEKHLSALREANSDVLKGGDQLKVGMKLRLPSIR
jgi:nucleoid-associated protein YgaU